MGYLLAILLPPLSLLLQGRPFQALFNAMLWVPGVILIILPFVAGQGMWLLSVIWAVAVVYNRRQEARDIRLLDAAPRRR